MKLPTLSTLALMTLLSAGAGAHSYAFNDPAPAPPIEPRSVKTLDLRHKGITQLPINPTQQKAIEVLDLSDNQLTEIPDIVYKMTNLRKLILREDRLARQSRGALHQPVI